LRSDIKCEEGNYPSDQGERGVTEGKNLGDRERIRKKPGSQNQVGGRKGVRENGRTGKDESASRGVSSLDDKETVTRRSRKAGPEIKGRNRTEKERKVGFARRGENRKEGEVSNT